ncbi:SRPBCC family protein [Kitasatospora sp. NPDC017646]|uniref:SRPBCC family protein n=1 Tax=Kitasatospora sp. NPDC017646 TaxID=3364024 RepID=UPI003791A85D
MAEQTKNQGSLGLGELLEALPTDRLMQQARDLMTAAGERAVSAASDKVAETTDRLIDYAENGAGSSGGSSDGGGGGGGKSPMRMLLGAGAAGVKQMVSNKLTGGGGGGGGKGGKLKVTNIVEEIEVGVPVQVAYNQWTQFQDFPRFTKRLEKVEQESDEKISWKAGIFLSHRTWESTIIKQVPDELIVWRSKGQKGHVDGAVTFHELTPNLTKILVVLEYHPQGLFERTGNLWRAQGRRTRLELKHFRRHVMTQTILDPDAVEGWRGEIRDGDVVKSHEDALEDERDEGDEGEYDEEDEQEPRAEDEENEEPGEGDDEESEPYDEDEYEDEDEEEPEDEYEDEEEPEDGSEDEEETEGELQEDDEEDEEEGPEDSEGDYGDEEYEEEDAEDEYEDEDEDEDEESGPSDADERTAPRRRRRTPARVR